MKRELITTIFLFVQLLAFAQIDSMLVDNLDSLVKEDQRWRGLMREAINSDMDSSSYESLSEKISYLDSLNYEFLSEVFKTNGYLGYDKVGKEGSHNFWLLVQHQDRYPDFQNRVLAEMKKQAKLDNASFTEYAYLIDRVRVNMGQLQIYGTQMILNDEKGSYEPKPLIDPEKLNERRKKAGLPPIDFYIKAMNERYFGTLKN